MKQHDTHDTRTSVMTSTCAQCPALLVPQTYGLVKEQTHPQTHRTLILITKVLQNLASKNEFSDKEVFMEAMNGFIKRNVSKVRVRCCVFVECGGASNWN
jgi:hypothetical protein